MGNYIATVAGQYNWTPHYIGTLYLDNMDHRGLIFWYDRVVEMAKELKKPAQGRPGNL